MYISGHTGQGTKEKKSSAEGAELCRAEELNFPHAVCPPLSTRSSYRNKMSS